MNVNSLNVSITSDDPVRLYTFYRDVIGLPVQEGMGDHALNVCGTAILFDGHSETHGKAKEPQRVWLNFFVDDVKAERERLEAAGVPFIRKEGKEYWGGIISTFVDPDGNYGQLLEFHMDGEGA